MSLIIHVDAYSGYRANERPSGGRCSELAVVARIRVDFGDGDLPKSRYEFREMSVYTLTVATRGKMKLSPDETRTLDIPSFSGAPTAQVGRGQMLGTMGASGEVRLSGHALSTSDLAKELRSHAGRIIVDKTGLNEVFDFDLKFTRDAALPLPLLPGAIPAPPFSPQSIPPLPGAALPGLPPLRSALEEQLGLKLESVKMPIEVLVIESVERPSEN